MLNSGETDSSTVPSMDSGTNGWETGLRTISVSLVALLVLLGLLGQFGVRATSTIASANGLTLAVDHAAATRPGLATPFAIRVSTFDGSRLPTTITARISSSYLDMFDENGLDPDPTSGYRTDEWTWWTFEVPTGANRFEVSFDARLEPAVQWGRDATIAIEVDDREMVAAHISTLVMP